LFSGSTLGRRTTFVAPSSYVSVTIISCHGATLYQLFIAFRGSISTFRTFFYFYLFITSLLSSLHVVPHATHFFTCNGINFIFFLTIFIVFLLRLKGQICDSVLFPNPASFLLLDWVFSFSLLRRGGFLSTVFVLYISSLLDSPALLVVSRTHTLALFTDLFLLSVM
jgi:hypothetical protein